ncbi:MAG: hypothetical protein ACK40O_02210 [Allosphingosinicella sp.]
MKKSLIALCLVAGCGASDPEGGNGAAALANGAAPAGPTPVAQAVRTSELTGLWEGGRTQQQQRDQMCIIDRGTGDVRFGIVMWGDNLHSCSGSGSVVREGSTLRLTMEGDEACAIDARIEGETVTLPATLPAGCAYYCGARARFDGGTLTRTGTTAADAMKATDLAGDPLCGG